MNIDEKIIGRDPTEEEKIEAKSIGYRWRAFRVGSSTLYWYLSKLPNANGCCKINS